MQNQRGFKTNNNNNDNYNNDNDNNNKTFYLKRLSCHPRTLYSNDKKNK